MWMSWYVQDTLIRQQLAEAHRRAAYNHLVQEARSRRAPNDLWRRLARLFRRHVTPDPVLVPQMKGREPSPAGRRS